MYKDILESTDHRDYPLPDKPWLMTQKWNDLLFIHLPVSQKAVAAKLPNGLELDTFQEKAWISILPFRVTNMHLRKMPPLPFFHSFLEINVRTYVRCNGLPGVYFFSLDANHFPAVFAARVATLPYFYAKMNMRREKDRFYIDSIRNNHSDITLKGMYNPMSEAYYPERSTLSYWLMERYFLWSFRKNRLFRGDIHHKPWKIQKAEAIIEKQTMLPHFPSETIIGGPFFHYADTKRVLIWPMKKQTNK